MEESLNGQLDQGLRTVDLFDNISEDDHSDPADPTVFFYAGGSNAKDVPTDSPTTGAAYVGPGRERNSKVSQGRSFLKLTSNHQRKRSLGNGNHTDSSYDGCVEETANPPSRAIDIQVPAPARLTQNASPRVSTISDDQKAGSRDSKDIEILAAHARALQALIRDKEGLNASTTHVARDGLPSIQESKPARQRSTSAPAKKVSLVPPPIDTAASKGHLPANIIRTPYPFTHRNMKVTKDLMTPESARNGPTPDSILVVSIRRQHANRKLRISRIVIPASLDIRTAKRGDAKGKEMHFASLDFDDAFFFRQLRAEYVKLSGPYRFFSARTLRRITTGYFGQSMSECGGFSILGSKAAETSHLMRSPRLLVSRGLSDSFSEDKLLEHYRNPGVGRARYTWVHWANRVASVSVSEQHVDGEPSRSTRDWEAEVGIADDQAAPLPGVGLEFVEDWSWARILFALGLVLLAAIAAVLLWVFLGYGWPDFGFRGAGGRIGTGILMGGFVLLVGWMCILAWMWISWLVS